MLQREAVRGNYLLVVLYRVPENPPCRDRALWYVTTSNPHIQWKQSVVEIAQVDVVWARWDKFALLKTNPALYFSTPIYIFSKANIKHIVHSENWQSCNVCKIRNRNSPTFNFVVPTRFLNFRLLHHWWKHMGLARWNAVTWQTVQRLMRVGYTSEGTGCAGTNSTQNVDQTDTQHSLAYYSLIRNIFALHGLAESR